MLLTGKTFYSHEGRHITHFANFSKRKA